MKIEIDVPDGVSGEWRVETFTVQKDEVGQSLSLMKYGRGVPGGTYKRLKRGGVVVMSNTPDEIRDFSRFVGRASGQVLVNGLGLGVLLKALLDKSVVDRVKVIEKSSDVIALVAPTYRNDPRVEIIHADCFEYMPPKGEMFEAVWHDIWDDICAANLPEMHRLHRKYGKRTSWQASWCRELCERAASRERSEYAIRGRW